MTSGIPTTAPALFHLRHPCRRLPCVNPPAPPARRVDSWRTWPNRRRCKQVCRWPPLAARVSLLTRSRAFSRRAPWVSTAKVVPRAAIEWLCRNKCDAGVAEQAAAW